MKHYVALVCLCGITWITSAQDTYHQDLVSFLQDSILISTVSPVVHQSEQSNLDRRYIYGNVDQNISSPTGQPFSLLEDINVKSAGDNRWDSGTGFTNLQTVSANDVILITFWARRLSETSELTVLAEDASSFAKELYLSYDISSEWTRYFFPFKSSKDFAARTLTLGFHLAAQVQHFEMGGFTVYNLGNIELSEAPATFAEGTYGGFEEDAAWRAPAQRRIDSLRRKNVIIQVLDMDGTPMPGVEVAIDMQRHEFGFGSAMVTCRMPGNNCFNPTYLEKILDLDGAGHGFNVAVTENALKWDAWEEQWIGPPDQTRSAIAWLNDNQIETRGHTIIWPGWDHMPEDMQLNQTDISYLTGRINERITLMLTDPILSEFVTEWDVLNEITLNRDLEMAYGSDPNYLTGREVYGEIFQAISELRPNHKNYVNDFVVFSGAGGLDATIERYHTYIGEILATDGAKLDGIGFQSHIGMSPISIIEVEETLNDFYSRYGLRMKVTEYDIDKKVAPETQAAYLADFLTVIFSHPGMDAFLMWGFWDGNHWLNNAPIFNQDWTIKPSGQAFIDKVFKEWWTNERANTTADGTIAFRPFKGTHKITINHGGTIEEHTLKTADTDTLTLTLGTTSVQHLPSRESYHIAPNPSANGRFSILAEIPGQIDLDIYTMEGKLLKRFHKISTNSPISTDLLPGIYFAKIRDEELLFVSKIIVK